MKTKDQKSNTTIRTSTVPITHIAPAKDNVHAKESRDSETMQGLVKSIEANGIIHRIIVRPDPKTERMVIVDGHRRFEAAKIAGLKEVPVEIRNADEESAMAVMLAANVQRLENDPVLEAEAIEKMFDKGMTRAEVAAAIGKSEAYVARRARITMLTDAWRDFAKRVPCTTDLLERVAAHEPELQNRIAADADIGEYETDGEPATWGEFSEMFRDARMLIAEAKFDTKECKTCQNNTACHQFLFSELQEDDKASCQNRVCFINKTNERIDAILAKLRKQGKPAKEVANKWAVPQYWEASEEPNIRHQQAYVWDDDGIKRILWSIAPEEKKNPAATKEEREAKKAERLRLSTIKQARDKLRRILTRDEDTGRVAFFETEKGAQIFERIAERRLKRDLSQFWISDMLCDDLMAEAANSDAVKEALTDEESKLYNEYIDGIGE